MTGSFKKIDYSIRPAKHAERRMLCDVFRRVWPFDRVENYVYVGFGSVWFADFTLFHRSLGVREMISIEASKGSEERIEANKPFRIPVMYQHSKDALPQLDWTRRQFLWLDYDDPISTDVLYDLQTVARRSPSGTLVAVSVQCSQAPQVSEAAQDSGESAPGALQRFVDKFGRERMPSDLADDDLFSWRFGALSRRMMHDELRSVLTQRNAASSDDMRFLPICEIEYEDGAKMTTIVGMFCSSRDVPLFEACRFDELDFLPRPLKPVRIEVPKLTIKEFKRLESQLPLAAGEVLVLGTVPVREARNFQALYRYLPSFAVLEG